MIDPARLRAGTNVEIDALDRLACADRIFTALKNVVHAA